MGRVFWVEEITYITMKKREHIFSFRGLQGSEYGGRQLCRTMNIKEQAEGDCRGC